MSPSAPSAAPHPRKLPLLPWIWSAPLLQWVSAWHPYPHPLPPGQARTQQLLPLGLGGGTALLLLQSPLFCVSWTLWADTSDRLRLPHEPSRRHHHRAHCQGRMPGWPRHRHRHRPRPRQHMRRRISSQPSYSSSPHAPSPPLCTTPVWRLWAMQCGRAAAVAGRRRPSMRCWGCEASCNPPLPTRQYSNLPFLACQPSPRPSLPSPLHLHLHLHLKQPPPPPTSSVWCGLRPSRASCCSTTSLQNPRQPPERRRSFRCCCRL
mmetsp:Transcript_29249/g.47204  ORF Transcript_29249/g.47204 Transcript_29249/m.47204 type:complete len:263 (+) Transcript_29249:489-1277(+)